MIVCACGLLAFRLLRSLVENIETYDYMKEGDVGFKKPKVMSLASIMCQALITFSLLD